MCIIKPKQYSLLTLLKGCKMFKFDPAFFALGCLHLLGGIVLGLFGNDDLVTYSQIIGGFVVIALSHFAHIERV